jgi:hypothetical protein
MKMTMEKVMGIEKMIEMVIEKTKEKVRGN